MTLNKLKSDFSKLLKGQYPTTEIHSFFYHLCQYKLGLKRVDISLNLDKKITSKDTAFFKKAANRLTQFEPIQYIIGVTEFYNLKFKVDKNVLIPRPETEELISWILDEVNASTPNSKLQTTKSKPQTLNILDIGTGSGCIAIALAKNLPQAKVWALDVSKEALKIAQQNAELNQVKINFVKADILKAIEILHFVQNDKPIVIASETQQSLTNKEITSVAWLLRKDAKKNVIETLYLQEKPSLTDKEIASVASRLRKDEQNTTQSDSKTSGEGFPLKFDIIVSNPPYVKQNEKPLMQANVLNHEPHIALFVEDNNSLIFYDKIADFTSNFLNKNGKLFFEINQSQGKKVCALLKEKGYRKIILKKDLFEVDRMIKAQLNS